MTKIDALAQWLRERDQIAILTHVHPDGDALGSTSAIRPTERTKSIFSQLLATLHIVAISLRSIGRALFVL